MELTQKYQLSLFDSLINKLGIDTLLSRLEKGLTDAVIKMLVPKINDLNQKIEKLIDHIDDFDIESTQSLFQELQNALPMIHNNPEKNEAIQRVPELGVSWNQMTRNIDKLAVLLEEKLEKNFSPIVSEPSFEDWKKPENDWMDEL